MSLELYNHLTVYGSVYDTNHFLPQSEKFVAWTEENFDYVHYNPRKDIKRYGLSITSLDGGVSGRPDLDSLYKADGIDRWSEMDFNVRTPVADHPEIKKLLDHFGNNVGRSHILKINPGGYFPPHRDFRKKLFDTFRIIVPLLNTDYPSFTFMLEDKVLNWETGRPYFLDTSKQHHLFNCYSEPSYWIVLNVATNEESVEQVLGKMKYS